MDSTKINRVYENRRLLAVLCSAAISGTGANATYLEIAIGYQVALMARSYLPSKVSEIVTLWRKDLKKVNKEAELDELTRSHKDNHCLEIISKDDQVEDEVPIPQPQGHDECVGSDMDGSIARQHSVKHRGPFVRMVPLKTSMVCVWARNLWCVVFPSESEKMIAPVTGKASEVCLPPANRNTGLLRADNEGDNLKWRGPCNGTRLQVLRMGTNVIEAKISGGSVGTICAIPRMVISPSDNKLSFKLNRRQFLFRFASV
ncbi:hypothetical protein Tco_0163500 [Tanacetum coccineum]